jgi:capsular exopolysaccharide synthesis family protein
MQQITAAPRPPDDAGKMLEKAQAYTGIALRNWKLIAVSVLIASMFATFSLTRSKTFYRASSRLLVIQQAGRALPGGGTEDPFRTAQDSNSSLSTHLLLIRSVAIVERAIKLSGLHNLSASAVIGAMTVKQPDETAKVIEVSYRSQSQDESTRVIEGIIRSYNDFLHDNFQKSTQDILALLSKARDDLNKEMTSLEQQFLEHRQKNPAYSPDDKGQSFLGRRLDQWDQSMNQVRARALQLKTQLQLGRKLMGEGLDENSISNALNQVGGMGGPQAPALTPTDAQVKSGHSIEALREQLADIESDRLIAELQLAHLQGQQAELNASQRLSDRDIGDAFYAIPQVADLVKMRSTVKAKLSGAQRIARSPSDPSVVELRKQSDQIEDAIQRLWEHHRPLIVERLRQNSNIKLTETLQDAVADLASLKAKEAALTEHLERLTAERLEQLRRELAEIRRLHGEGHPQARSIEQQIAEIEANRDHPASDKPGAGKTGVLLSSIAKSLESIEAMHEEIKKQFDEDLDSSRKSEIGKLREENLRSNLDRNRTLFNSVVDQLKHAQLLGDFGSISTRTIDPPEVATEPRKVASTLAMALVGGLGIGTFLAVVIEVLDAKVHTVTEMRGLLNQPVIGLIPQLSDKQDGATGSLGLLCHETPRSNSAESYKSTRTRLEFLRRTRDAQVLLVGSPQAGDGKSVTASNLAISMAHAGRRVLLIDGDLRKPSLHTIFNVSRDRGLTDALRRTDPIEELVQRTLVDHLDLLTSGPDVPNPAELLASPRLGELLAAIRQIYDFVIFDSSPLMTVTDSSIIAAVSDGILLVLRLSATRRHEVERTMELLGIIGIPVLGTLINGIRNTGFGYNYGYQGYDNGRSTPSGTTLRALESVGTAPDAPNIAT